MLRTLCSPRPRSPRPPRVAVARRGLAVAACALFLAGCEEARKDIFETKHETRAPAAVGVDLSGGNLDERPAARPAAPAPAPQAKKREMKPILGERTQDIRDANTEFKNEGAQKASPRIVSRDPITLPGNAYVSIIGQAAFGNIKHAVDLWQATNGRYPKDYQEFMDEIIKANNISLPLLPHYQEYSYDANTHSLIIVEYPDRK